MKLFPLDSLEKVRSEASAAAQGNVRKAFAFITPKRKFPSSTSSSANHSRKSFQARPSSSSSSSPSKKFTDSKHSSGRNKNVSTFRPQPFCRGAFRSYPKFSKPHNSSSKKEV